jgi:hypothetical protein
VAKKLQKIFLKKIGHMVKKYSREKGKKMRKTMVLLMAILMFFAVNKVVSAEDLETALSVASYNIPPGADVAGKGNTWVASPDFSSNNPAVLGASKEFKFGASGTYSRINFDKGPGINLWFGNVTAKLGPGVILVNYTDLNSGFSQTKTGEEMSFKPSPSVNVMYGLKVADNFLRKGDKLFIGASISPYAKSENQIRFEGEGVKNTGDSFSAGLGLLYQLSEGINIGAYYGSNWVKSEVRDLYSGEKISDANSRSDQARLGVSWQVFPMTTISVDYQYLNIDGNAKHQLFAGVEEGIIADLLYAYAGWAGQGPTAGIGLYFKYGGINFAYMNNPFPEANSSFGQGQLWMLTLYLNF